MPIDTTISLHSTISDTPTDITLPLQRLTRKQFWNWIWKWDRQTNNWIWSGPSTEDIDKYDKPKQGTKDDVKLFFEAIRKQGPPKPLTIPNPLTYEVKNRFYYTFAKFNYRKKDDVLHNISKKEMLYRIQNNQNPEYTIHATNNRAIAYLILNYTNDLVDWPIIHNDSNR